VRGLDLEKEALKGAKLFDWARQDEARRKIVKHLDHERLVFGAAFFAHCRRVLVVLSTPSTPSGCTPGHQAPNARALRRPSFTAFNTLTSCSKD